MVTIMIPARLVCSSARFIDTKFKGEAWPRVCRRSSDLLLGVVFLSQVVGGEVALS